MSKLTIKLSTKKKALTSLLLLTTLITGCQNNKQIKPTEVIFTSSTAEERQNSIDDNSYQQIAENPWSFVQNQLQIDIPDNRRIVNEKEKIVKGKGSFEKNLLRSEPYIYYIINQLNERNMPVELALIPLIESAYNPAATSYSKAAGLWQIVPITARQYGLTKNSWYDPRKDVIESTNTAINLLQYLNKQFDGDWLLTLAAYNAGEGRVKKAITWNKSKKFATNFWALNLPKETMIYVPKFLAITDLIRHNERYNITLPDFEYDNALVKLKLSKQMSFAQITKYSGLSMDELVEYNAGYLKKIVKDPYHLLIPANSAKTLYENLAESKLLNSAMVNLLELKVEQDDNKYSVSPVHLTNDKYVKITDKEVGFYQEQHNRYKRLTHKVKPGDNLYSIAKTYHVKVGDIVKWNKIKNPQLLRLGTKLTIELQDGRFS